MGLVYDLFGNGKTAVKYSLNRYNLSRTTGIAANYNPLLSQTATLPWIDKNRNDVAEGSLRCDFTSPDCEINFASLSANYGIAALNEYGAYPRTWNLEQGVEFSHELLDGLSIGANWWHGSFHNLTNTVNQSWSTADYSPYTWYNPTTGQPFTVYARTTAATARPIRNLDTFDPERKNTYDSYGFDAKWRIPGGGQINGGLAVERERVKSCTAPDDPNYVTATAGVFNGVALCDDYALDIPWRPAVQDVGHQGNRLGHQPQHVVPEQLQPDQLAHHDRDARRHALPGQLPVALPGRRDHHADRRLRPDDDELHAGVGAPVVGGTDRSARHQGRAHVPLRPLPGAADVRGVQPQQLGRDHQLQHHQRPVDDLPGAQQHHAGPHVWIWSGVPLLS